MISGGKTRCRANSAEVLLGEIATLGTQFDVFRFLRRVCDLFGLSAFMVMQLPDTSAERVSETSLINNWPSEMISDYDALDLFSGSPLLQHVRQSTTPTEMTLEERTAATVNCMRDEVDALFRRHGFLLGVAIPVHDTAGRRAAIFFHGNRHSLGHGEMLDLNMLGVHVYEQLARIMNSGERDASPLTAREMECLSWTAEGKTSSETAAIVGLSEHTVNHYLNRAARKLGSVNRTQAVAKALRSGWLK